MRDRRNVIAVIARMGLMKNVNIDSVNAGLDDYRNQPFKIEFTGGLQKGRTQGPIQSVTVAYSSLSRKLQSIHRLGGKIVNVSIPRFHAENIDTKDIASDISENIIAIAQSLEPLVDVNIVKATQGTNAITLEHIEFISEAETVAEFTSSVGADFVAETTAEVASKDSCEIVERIIEPEPISEIVSVIEPEEISNNLTETELTSEKTVETTVEVVNIPETPKTVSTKIETNESKSEHLEINSVVTEVVTEQKLINPQKSKPITLTTKLKKSKASAKSHGFNKRESKPTTHEPIFVDVIDSSHHNVALPLGKEPEHLIQQVVEINPDVSMESVKQASGSIADQEVSEQDIIPELAIETAPVLAESVISNTVAAKTFIPAALENNLEIAETVVTFIDEALEINVDAVVNEQLQHEESIPESHLEPSQTGICDTLEPIVEDIHAIATETISASMPPVEAATALTKPKKSKTVSKSGHGFNKPKSPKISK